MAVVAEDPHLLDALLYEWIAANTVSFSVGFAKLGAMFYILDVQRGTNRHGRWALFFAVGMTQGRSSGMSSYREVAQAATGHIIGQSSQEVSAQGFS